MRAAELPFFQPGSPSGSFLALAHRGGALHPENVGRENSRHAFATAVRLGYRYLETDVHATADGRLVAFHDKRLDRATDGTGAVADLPFGEVAQARIGGIDPIPTLDELLESFPQCRFNIDIKAPGAVEPLLRTLRSHAAEGRVCVGSFDVRRLHAFRRRAGREVATSASSWGVAWQRYVPLLPRWIGTAGAAFQMPIEDVRAGIRLRLLTPGFVDRAHQRGSQVHVWTVNDPATMERLIDAGVDGIVTDRIDVLKQVLQSRGRWSEEAS